MPEVEQRTEQLPTRAWMPEVEQRREQLPTRAWMPEVEQRREQWPGRRDDADVAAHRALARDEAPVLDRRHRPWRDVAALADAVAVDDRAAARGRRLAVRHGSARLARPATRRALTAVRWRLL